MENRKLISEIGTKSLEPTGDPFILTRKRPCGPFSFVDSTKAEFSYDNPPPIYVKMEHLNEKKSFNKETTFEDFKVDKKGLLKLENEDIKEKQRGVVLDVFKDAATKIMEGANVIGMSLPVRIFEPRSQMERLLDNFQGFPKGCKKMLETDDPVERLKILVVSFVSVIHHSMSQYKPFNPILGETYTGKFDDETDIYLEHISHHPPICAYHFVNKRWTYSGKWAFNAEIGIKSIKPYNDGWGLLELEDGDKYELMQPLATLGGMIAGSRTLKISGALVIINKVNKLKAVVRFGEKSGIVFSGQADLTKGKIYTYKEEKHQDALKKKKWLDKMDKMKKMEDVDELKCEIDGSWQKQLTFNKEVLWDIDENKDYYDQQRFSPSPLPSDIRFREDIIWLSYGNESYAQNWKVKLEQQQRSDRKCRNKK